MPILSIFVGEVGDDVVYEYHSVCAPKKIKTTNGFIGPKIFVLERDGYLINKVDDDRIHALGLFLPKRKTAYFRDKICMDDTVIFKSACDFRKIIIQGKTEHTNQKTKVAMIDYFNDILKKIVINNKDQEDEKIIICSVPTSKPSEIEQHGITLIARKLAEETGNIDGTNILIRDCEKDSFHTDGARTIDAAKKGLKIAKIMSVKNRAIILLDDVCVSGKSMKAARDLLVKAGAARVVCLSLSRAFINKNEAHYRPSMLEVLLKEYLLRSIATNNTSLKNIFKTVENSFSTNVIKSPHSAQQTYMRDMISLKKRRLSYDIEDEHTTNVSPMTKILKRPGAHP